MKTKLVNYFPYFFVTQLFEENFQTTQRHCRFGFLSRQPRPHRLYLYQKTKKYITRKTLSFYVILIRLVSVYSKPDFLLDYQQSS